MSAPRMTQDHIKATTPSAPRNGQWQLPNGRVAAARTRRAIRAALQAWGIGPVANDVAALVVSLVRELESSTAAHGGGPVDLRLELRKSACLLLGEVRRASPGPPQPGGPKPAGEDGPGVDGYGARVAAIAVTYGRRPALGGTATWYAHSFTW